MNNLKISNLVVATTNRGKLAELKQSLEPLAIHVKSLDHFPKCAEAVEDGKTFRENARIKAQHYSRHTHQWILADDSGLSIDALNGEPGIYSSRYAATHGIKTPNQDLANIEKVLEQLADIPAEQRQARFRCALCLCDPQTNVHIEVEGTMEGVIINEMRGDNGFGYDPIFYLPEIEQTVAQITPEEKLRRSHRGQALQLLLAEIQSAGLV